MTDAKISSANNDISFKGGARKSLNARSLASLPKDVRKRWLIVGGALALVIAASATMMQSGKKGPKVAASVAAGTVDTTPKGINSQQDWRTQTGADVIALRKTLADSQATQKELLARMEALRQEMSTIKTTGGTGPAAAPTLSNNANRIDFNLPPPPVAPSLGKALPTALTPATQVSVGRTAGNDLSTGAVGASGSLSTGAPSGSLPGYSSAPTKRTGAKGFIPEGAGSEAVNAKVAQAYATQKLVPNDKQGYLPAGSFVSATLISGVEAFTGGTAQSQPQPLVVRLDENAILPNNAGYVVKGCHILASVYGDMSSERVFGRTSTLTCVDMNNKLVLSEEVEGTLIDSDGKNGIRGSLQDRQGAKLARSLLAGFAQGLSAAFGAAQSTTTAGAAGMTTAFTGDTLKAAGYGGAGKAAEQLSQFYMKQAESTMPIIAVDAGRRVSVLFTKSKSLKFETIDTYRVQPETNLTVERVVPR